MTEHDEILLVDDTPQNLQVLGELLRREGFTVRVAPSGALALRSVAARRPDLILLDIRMPEMDGFETCRRLRSDANLLAVPILFLSASDAVEDRLGAFAAGGQDFINKPFQAAEVLARVSTHLSLAKARRELDRRNDELAMQVENEGARRAKAERRASERQLRLEHILAAANTGYWEVDPTDMTVIFDARARAILGCDAGYRPRWQDFVNQLNSENGHDQGTATVRRRQQPHFFDLSGWWQVGEERRRLRLRGQPLFIEGDRHGPLVGLLWDISDEFILRERVAANQRLEALGLLTSSVAHDFNNHLAVIIGAVEIMHLRGGIPQELRSHLDSIGQASEASTALVRDLLGFSRQHDDECEPMDLTAITSRACALAKHSLSNDTHLECVLSDHSCCIDGNPSQIQNALLNLCVNARDAMPGGGHIKVRVGLETVKEAFCAISKEYFHGTWATVQVQDSGEGIPDHIRDRIFEPFFTTKAMGKGTGLGLASVLGCIRRHHGHLSLQSQTGNGTTFTLYFPPSDMPLSDTCATPATRDATRRGRILLCDDQDTVRMTVAEGLTRLGWEVEAIADPLQALACWSERGPFHAALVDMVMPGLSGLEVFQAIRDQDQQARVLLMSGHDLAAIPCPNQHAGLAGFVSKPVRIRQLSEMLAGL